MSSPDREIYICHVRRNDAACKAPEPDLLAKKIAELKEPFDLEYRGGADFRNLWLVAKLRGL